MVKCFSVIQYSKIQYELFAKHEQKKGNIISFQAFDKSNI